MGSHRDRRRSAVVRRAGHSASVAARVSRTRHANLVVRLIALLVALSASATGSAAAAQRFIPLLQPGDAVPPIPLVAQDGRSFALENLHGKAVAVSFIYTRCGDARMC